MNNRNFLEYSEITYTFVNLIVVKMFFTYPRRMIVNAGNAAWIQMIYVSLIALAIYLIIFNLNKKSPMDNIFDLCEKVGGKAFRIVAGLIILSALFIKMAMTVRVFPESIKTVLLPNTPTKLIMIIFVLAISAGAYLGLYSICRIHSIFMPIVAIVMLGFLLLLLPDVKINNIFPLAGTGTKRIFVNGLENLSLFSDMMIIFIIMPFCKNKRDTKRSLIYTILIGGLSAAVMLLIYCLIYPYPVSEEFIIPVYHVAQIARIGSYFQRLEAFFEFSWSIAMLLYASFYLFVICYSFTEIFKTKYYREVIIPIVLLVSAAAFIPKNFIGFLDDGYAIFNLFFPFMFIIPAAAGVWYKIKK